MRNLFATSLAAAWLCVIAVGMQSVPESAAIAETVFTLIVLWIWIAAVSTFALPRKIWVSAPRTLQVIMLACVLSVLFSAIVYHLVPRLMPSASRAVIAAGGDGAFVVLLISAIVAPIAVLVAYVRRRTTAASS